MFSGAQTPPPPKKNTKGTKHDSQNWLRSPIPEGGEHYFV